MVVKFGFSAATGQKGRGYQKSPGDLPLLYQVLFPDIKLTMHVKANDLATQSRFRAVSVGSRLELHLRIDLDTLAHRGPVWKALSRTYFGTKFGNRPYPPVGKSCIVLLHAAGAQWQLGADTGSGSLMESLQNGRSGEGRKNRPSSASTRFTGRMMMNHKRTFEDNNWRKSDDDTVTSPPANSSQLSISCSKSLLLVVVVA
ncbi:hypothetical protein TPS_05133 [Trichinella pseudospiralis]